MLSKQKSQQIRNMAHAGATAQEISDRLEVPLRKVVARMPKESIDGKVEPAMIALMSGKTLDEVGREFDRTAATIRGWYYRAKANPQILSPAVREDFQGFYYKAPAEKLSDLCGESLEDLLERVTPENRPTMEDSDVDILIRAIEIILRCRK